MIYLSIFLLLLASLFLFSRNESIPVQIEVSKITLPFYKIGAFIYRKYFEKRDNFYYRKIYEKNSMIYSAKENMEVTKAYLIEKTGICFLVMFVGLFFTLLISFNENDKSIVENGHLLKRGSYDGSDYKVVLNAEVEREVVKGIEIEVYPRKYSEDGFYELMPEICEKLEDCFLSKNESTDCITEDVNLADEIEGYPFVIDWKLSPRGIITPDGKISDDVPEEGILVSVNAEISYEEYAANHNFSIMVYPPNMTYIQSIKKKIIDKISLLQNESLQEEYMLLPEEIDGIKIVWKEEKTKNTLVFTVLIIVTVIGIFIGKDRDLDKKIEGRNQQMLEDYSEIIGKLTLLIGAGMTVTSAWKKIVSDYETRKKNEGKIHYAYEEMLYTIYEIESGVEESICFTHFMNRVKLQKYIKMVSLLEQNMKMGARGLIKDLKKESADAFADRKSLAEKKGEEAGTKLLVPMFMMLLIVMVVIMIPAFMSM